MSPWRLAPIIGLAVLAAVVIVSGYRAFDAMETLPGYLLEAGALQITNCDPPHDARARTTCERLHCWRALLEDGALQSDVRLERGEARPSPDGDRVVHIAPLVMEAMRGSARPDHVRCVMRGYEVERLDLLDDARLKALRDRHTLWDPDAIMDGR